MTRTKRAELIAEAALSHWGSGDLGSMADSLLNERKWTQEEVDAWLKEEGEYIENVSKSLMDIVRQNVEDELFMRDIRIKAEEEGRRL